MRDKNISEVLCQERGLNTEEESDHSAPCVMSAGFVSHKKEIVVEIACIEVWKYLVAVIIKF